MLLAKRFGLNQQAIVLHDKMMANGIKPTQKSFMTALYCCMTSREDSSTSDMWWDTAMDIHYDAMNLGIKANLPYLQLLVRVASYHARIDSLEDEIDDLVDRAWGFHYGLREKNPSEVHLSMLPTIYSGMKRSDDALRVLRLMRDHEHMSPSATHYSQVLKCFDTVRVGNEGEIVREMLQEISSSNMLNPTKAEGDDNAEDIDGTAELLNLSLIHI